jgi:hypothetical protein
MSQFAMTPEPSEKVFEREQLYKSKIRRVKEIKEVVMENPSSILTEKDKSIATVVKSKSPMVKKKFNLKQHVKGETVRVLQKAQDRG